MNQAVPILRYLGSLHGYYNAADADAAYSADLAIATVDDGLNGDFYKCFFPSADALDEEGVKKRVEVQTKMFTSLAA